MNEGLLQTWSKARWWCVRVVGIVGSMADYQNSKILKAKNRRAEDWITISVLYLQHCRRRVEPTAVDVEQYKGTSPVRVMLTTYSRQNFLVLAHALVLVTNRSRSVESRQIK
jgi:hypothetical protein